MKKVPPETSTEKDLLGASAFRWANPGHLVIPAIDGGSAVVDTSGPRWVIPQVDGGAPDAFNWSEDFFHTLIKTDGPPSYRSLCDYLRAKIDRKEPLPLRQNGEPNLKQIARESRVSLASFFRQKENQELLRLAAEALEGERPSNSVEKKLSAYLKATPVGRLPRTRGRKVHLAEVCREAGISKARLLASPACRAMRDQLTNTEGLPETHIIGSNSTSDIRSARPLRFRELRARIGPAPVLVPIADDIREAVKAWAAHWLCRYGASCVASIYSLKSVFELLPPLGSASDISRETADDLKRRLETSGFQMSTAGKLWSAFRRWYNWCTNQRLPGFSRETDRHIKELRWKRSPSHAPVREADPVLGPLDHSERALIRSALREGRGQLLDRVCIGLLEQLGARPQQLLLIREDDLRDLGGFWSVRLPLLKGRVRGPVPRQEFPINSESLWVDLQRLVAMNRRSYPDDPDLPVLLRPGGDGRKPAAITRRMFRDALRRWVVETAITSPITGGPLFINARRFRYTLGTVLVQQGAPEGVVARALGHRTISAQQAYSHSSDGMVPRLDSTLGVNEEFTAQMLSFRGQPVDRASVDASRRTIYGTIQQTLTDVGALGICDADFFCGVTPPTACYSCPKFQPFIDGPHEKVLAQLTRARDDLRLATELSPGSPIPFQLDDAIVGCRSCIAACEAKRAEGAGKRRKTRS